MKIDLVNEFTEAQEPLLVGKALDVLSTLGWDPVVFVAASGRALLSGGFLPEAKKLAQQVISPLQKLEEQLGQFPIVGLEASAVLSANDEYHRLLDGDELAWIKEHDFQTIDCFLAKTLPQLESPQEKFIALHDEILLHVHCHQKSLESASHTAVVLEKLLGARVRKVKSSCCGMAGSYGMKKAHFDMSVKMANLVLIPAVEAFHGEWVVATGTSCRHQIHDLTEREAFHVVDVLWGQLKR